MKNSRESLHLIEIIDHKNKKYKHDLMNKSLDVIAEMIHQSSSEENFDYKSGYSLQLLANESIYSLAFHMGTLVNQLICPNSDSNTPEEIKQKVGRVIDEIDFIIKEIIEPDLILTSMVRKSNK